MNPLYRIWWRTLMDLRPITRFLAERFPWSRSPAVRLRSLAHLLVGNPLQTLALTAAIVAWWTGGLSFRVAAGLSLASVLLYETWHRLAYADGGWLVGWREGWRVRRLIPSVWAQVAAKTHRVQAEVGTSKEPTASAVLRPIADHPKMSWWPKVEWPVVSWWVGPPPGRTLAALDEVADALAANLSHAISVVIDYERTTDSHARLIVSFHDVLAQPSPPPWTEPAPHLEHDTGPTNPPTLWLVEDHEHERVDEEDGEVA